MQQSINSILLDYNKRKKTNKFSFDYIFAFILIIYAGSATVFVRSLNTWEDLIGLSFIIIITLLYAIHKRTKLNRKVYLLITAFVVYFILLTIKFDALHPRFLGIYLISFLIAFVCISNLGYRFFIIYEDILFYLSLVSIMFWAIMLFIPQQLAHILNLISFSEPAVGNVQSNIVFFTINAPDIVEISKINIGGLSFFRNSGFAWESGAFAVFINLAMFINLIINRFKLNKNKKLWVMFAALLTTFSTTGYSIFFVLVLFYLNNVNQKYKVLLMPIVFLIGFYVFSVSFMTEKIIEASQQNTEQLIEKSILYETSYAPQRITSLVIDFQDFQNNPILGYGGHQEERWTNKLGANIASISGIGKIFSKFGLIGAIFFFVFLIKSSKFLKSIFKFKGWVFPFLIIIMISISYSLIEHPLFMCFWMVAFFYPKNKIMRYKYNLLNK